MKQYFQKVKQRIQDQWVKYIIIVIMFLVAMTRNAANYQKSTDEPVKLTEEQIARTKQYQNDTIIQYGLMSLAFLGLLAFVKVLNNRYDKRQEQQKQKNK